MKSIGAFVVTSLSMFVLTLLVTIGVVGIVDSIALKSFSGFDFYGWPDNARVLAVSVTLTFGLLIGFMEVWD